MRVSGMSNMMCYLTNEKSSLPTLDMPFRNLVAICFSQTVSSSQNSQYDICELVIRTDLSTVNVTSVLILCT
jgi:hypothetical protein